MVCGWVGLDRQVIPQPGKGGHQCPGPACPRRPAQYPGLPRDPHVTPRGAGRRGCHRFLARALRRSRQERVCLPRGPGPRGGGRKGGGLCLRASRRSAGGQGKPGPLAASGFSVTPGCLQPRLGPWSSPDPLTPRLGPTLLQGNPRSLADLVGEGSGLGGIHMESGSEPRTRASPPSAWPRASASLSWATAALPSGQPRATTPSPGTAMSPRPPRTATLPNPPRRLVQLWAQPGGQAGTEGPEGPGPHGTRPAVLPPSPRPRSRSPRQEPW